MQANGQPMIDKRGGYRFLAKTEAHDLKGISLIRDIKAQEERIEMLEN